MHACTLKAFCLSSMILSNTYALHSTVIYCYSSSTCQLETLACFLSPPPSSLSLSYSPSLCLYVRVCVRVCLLQFEALNFPYDVIWLDIEHTDGKRYYTWDSHLFPTPEDMIHNISAHGRKVGR